MYSGCVSWYIALTAMKNKKKKEFLTKTLQNEASLAF